MRRIKVLIVDDQLLFAGSLKVVIEGHGKDDMQVVGIAHNGEEAIAVVGKTMPDVVLMDVRMPVVDGVEATRIIHEHYSEIKIMMLTTFEDDDYVVGALNNGACGYVLKNIEPEELIDSIRAVHRGNLLLSSNVRMHLIGHHVQLGEGTTEQLVGDDTQVDDILLRFSQLSRREAEVLNLMLRKLDNREIADRLFIAEQTVKNYVSQIYVKLGVDNRLHAIKRVESEQR